MKLLANKVHMQGMEVLLADKVHKQEPQRVFICFTHATIPTAMVACVKLYICYRDLPSANVLPSLQKQQLDKVNNTYVSLPAYCWSSHSFFSLASSYTTFILRWNRNLTLKGIIGSIRKCCVPKCSQKVALLLMKVLCQSGVTLTVCSWMNNTEKCCSKAAFLSLLMITDFTMSVPLEHTHVQVFHQLSLSP